MIEKLQAHYGFSRMPFGRNLAPGMLHRHASHNEAVARISWCISERAIGVITGEVEAGKTVSVRTVLAGLDPSRHTVVYLPNPMIGIRGICEEILATFGQPPSPPGIPAVHPDQQGPHGRTRRTRPDPRPGPGRRTPARLRAAGRPSGCSPTPRWTRLPLACLLVGQPTLRRTMKLAVLAALEQRTALRFAMPPMTTAETTSYVNHHLNLAGRPDQLFTEDALNLIHTTSRGYPRAVNNLALQSLVAAFAASKNLVDETATRSAVSEVVD